MPLVDVLWTVQVFDKEMNTHELRMLIDETIFNISRLKRTLPTMLLLLAQGREKPTPQGLNSNVF